MSETVEELEQIIEYLKTSRTVWRTVAPTTDTSAGSSSGNRVKNTYDNNWPLVQSTFFYGVRANTAPRLYMWGQVGDFSTYKKQPMYIGAVTTLLSVPVAAASAAAREQVLPAAGNVGTATKGIYAPNTEEFLSRGSVHKPLANVVSIAALQNAVVMACDSDGKLYVRGDVRTFDSNDPPYNQLGLGPRRESFGSEGSVFFAGNRLNSPCKQYDLQRVYGDDPSFGSVTFVKVQASWRCCAALDDQGYIWFAGDATGVSSSDEYPADPSSSRQFDYYRKQVVNQWIDIHGNTQNGELTFSDFWLEELNSNAALALTHDGKLYVVGASYGWGGSGTTSRYRQIGGFIDTIAPVSGQPIISTSNVTITIAAPPAGGVRATASAIMRSVGVGQWTLFGVRLNNPGSGYTSPPVVTVSYGSTSRTDLVACTVFDGTWKAAHMNSSRYAAISSAGVLYLWGIASYNNAITKTAYGTVTNTLNANSRVFEAPIRAVQFQQAGQSVPQQPGEYDKVCVRSGGFGGDTFGGVALSVSGQMTYWGVASRTPNGTLTRELTAWPDGTYIDCAISGAHQIALIDSNNDAYTYGEISPALGHGSELSSSLGISGYRSITKVVGSAKWSRVFGMQGFDRGFYAVRLPEQLDEFGVRKNPLPPFGS